MADTIERAVLTPLTALGGTEARFDRIGAVTITEEPDLALASLALRAGEAEDALGLALPGPGRHGDLNGARAFWLGPRQWLVLADGAARDLAAELADRWSGRVSVTDQTDAWVSFSVTAPAIAPLLQRLTMLDAAQLSEGEGTRGLIEHLGCLILCLETGRRVSILGPRSSAASLHHALAEAARSLAAEA